MSKGKWFVRRASDDTVKHIDGSWKMPVVPAEVKFYSSSGRADRFGFAGCPAVHNGNTYSYGTCYNVLDGWSVCSDGIIRKDKV